MDMAINVGETLKKWRLERGLTLKEVSQALHFSVSVLSEYEKGITTPSVERLLALMDFYGIETFNALIKNEELVNITHYTTEGKRKAHIIHMHEKEIKNKTDSNI